MSFAYSSAEEGFSPPAPTTRGRVRARINRRESAQDFLMLIDTGADCCCIPLEVISRLESELDTSLLYDLTEVEGFSGEIVLQKVYYLDLEVESFGSLEQVQFLVLDRAPFGILGRDIVNTKPVLLDGPELQWSIP